METPIDEPVGEYLRRAREKRGEHLDGIASTLRVPRRYLEALETGNYSALPETPYSIGYIRAYARHLGTPAEPLVRRFKEDVQPSDPDYTCYWHEPEAESRLPQRTFVFGGLIATIVAYSLWFSFNNSADADIALKPAVPDHLLAVASAENKAPDAAPKAQALSLAWVPPAPQSAEVERSEEITLASTKVAEKTAPVVEQRNFDLFQARVAEHMATVAALGFEAADVPPPQMVTVAAIEDSWIHVTAGGKVLFSAVVPAGEEYTPPPRSGVIMTTGNAGGVILKGENWQSAPLGEQGRVKRNIPLDAVTWRSKLAELSAL